MKSFQWNWVIKIFSPSNKNRKEKIVIFIINNYKGLTLFFVRMFEKFIILKIKTSQNLKLDLYIKKE